MLQSAPLEAGACRIKLVSPGKVERPSKFRSSVYFSGLSSKQLGRNLILAAELPSTQTLLHQNFARLPDGSVCLADVQTSGKGRGANTWTSPEGCLMFSIYKTLSIGGDQLPFVQYVVSLACVKAIGEIIQRASPGKSGVDIGIKWPNDIYSAGMKIGGILCQSVYREGSFHLIIGAGINVYNDQPTTCVAALLDGGDNAAEMHQHLREMLLASIVNHLEDLLDTLRETGFDALKSDYLHHWLHSDQKVVLEEAVSGQMQEISVTITGLSKNGYMTAADAAGETYELHPDGNSFDFFKGLVRRKEA